LEEEIKEKAMVIKFQKILSTGTLSPNFSFTEMRKYVNSGQTLTSEEEFFENKALRRLQGLPTAERAVIFKKVSADRKALETEKAQFL
jgi:hypothetical protein